MKNLKQNTFLAGLFATAILGADAFAASNNSGATPELKESTGYYKKQLVKAEDNFYDLFNELTENEAFRVKCKRKTIDDSFSRIKKRVCESKFKKLVEKGKLVQINDAFPELNITRMETKEQKLRQFDRLKRMQSAHIEELVAKHDTLRAKYDAYSAAKKTYWLAKNRS